MLLAYDPEKQTCRSVCCHSVLIDACILTDGQDTFGYQPLHGACENGAVELMELLLSHNPEAQLQHPVGSPIFSRVKHSD